MSAADRFPANQNAATFHEDSYVKAVECRTCCQLFSIELADLAAPFECPHCRAHYMPLSVDVLTALPQALRSDDNSAHVH